MNSLITAKFVLDTEFPQRQECHLITCILFNDTNGKEIIHSVESQKPEYLSL